MCFPTVTSCFNVYSREMRECIFFFHFFVNTFCVYILDHR